MTGGIGVISGGKGGGCTGVTGRTGVITGDRYLTRTSSSRVSRLVCAPASGVRGERRGMIGVRFASQVTSHVSLL